MENPYTPLAWPSDVDLRADPFERATHESAGYAPWAVKRMYVISAAAIISTAFLKTFLDFPPRQEPGSFSAEVIMKNVEDAWENLFFRVPSEPETGKMVLTWYSLSVRSYHGCCECNLDQYHWSSGLL